MPTAVRSSKILIVEDEYLIAVDQQNRLASMGYDNVSLADSFETAVEMAKEQCPDLIVMNVDLRGRLRGMQAAELIRRRFPVAIVYISGSPSRAGVPPADSCLHKPFSDLAFRRAVEKALA